MYRFQAYCHVSIIVAPTATLLLPLNRWPTNFKCDWAGIQTAITLKPRKSNPHRVSRAASRGNPGQRD